MTARTTCWLALGWAALAASLGSGCGSTYSLEPGLWRLNARGQTFDRKNRVSSGTQDLIRDARVEVRLYWKDDHELVEIEFAGADERQRQMARTIAGEVVENEEEPGQLVLRAIGRDDRWEFQLMGEVIRPDQVEGDILGWERVYRDEGFQGNFWLEKIAEE